MDATQKQARECIGELVQYFEFEHKLYTFTNGKIKVNEVVKGGSLGHGTAVNGDFDIDLVIYSESVTGDKLLRSGYDEWLRMLESFVRQHREAEVKQRSPHAVQFKFRGIKVDLLISPNWDTPAQFFEFLKRVRPPGHRSNFTVCASKWQVDFMEKQPNQVKDFVRKAKEWRNGVWPKDRDTAGRPKSYLLGLLVAYAYEESGAEGTRDAAARTTRKLRSLVENHRTLDIWWEHFYERRDYPSLLPSRPRIVDPANPSNNLYESGIADKKANDRSRDYEPGDGNWAGFAGNVHTLDLS